MGPGGEAALRNGRALRGTGRFQRRRGLDRAIGAPAAGRALHAHSDLGAPGHGHHREACLPPPPPAFEEGRAARPRALGRQKGLPDPQPVGSFRAGPAADPARLSVSPGHRTTLRATGSSLRPARPPHLLRPCVLRTHSASERPPASGLHRLGPPPREVSDRGELQPAHTGSPAAFLPTLLRDGGWEPGIGGGSNHTAEAGKHCRSGLSFFFFFSGKLVVNHSAAHHYS